MWEGVIMLGKRIYSLKCIECGAEFFTGGERGFCNSKGLNIPKRYKACRDKKKASMSRIKKIGRNKKSKKS